MGKASSAKRRQRAVGQQSVERPPVNQKHPQTPQAFRRDAHDLIRERRTPDEPQISPQLERDLKAQGLVPVSQPDLEHLLQSAAENLQLRQQLAQASQQQTSGFGCALCVSRMRAAWTQLAERIKDLPDEDKQSAIRAAVQAGQAATQAGQPLPPGALPPVRSGDTMVMGTVYCSACAPDPGQPGKPGLLVPPAGMSVQTAVRLASVG